MKLGITLTDLDFERTKSAGIMNVALGLVKGLSQVDGIRELHVLSNSSIGRPVTEGEARLIYHCLDMASPHGAGRLLWDQFHISHVVRGLKLDWLIFPRGAAPIPTWPSCKVCCYVHDRIYDYYADQSDNPFPRHERHYFPACMRRALKRADLVVTNSQFTCECLQPERGSRPCYPLGIGFEFPEEDRTTAPHGRNGILLLTSPLPHKRTQQAVEWLLRWEDETGNRRPVFGVGTLPDACIWPDRPHWIRSDRLHESHYRALHRECEILIYFSDYEGYAMPPVEAIGRGLRTLSSDIPPMRESLPPDILFNNDRYTDFSTKLNAALEADAPPAMEWPSHADIARKLVSLMRKI